MGAASTIFTPAMVQPGFEPTNSHSESGRSNQLSYRGGKIGNVIDRGIAFFIFSFFFWGGGDKG